MGQVALGIRSLLVRFVVFVIMAALLAWALGGTLWPRPATASLAPVDFDGRQWHWQLLVGGSGSEQREVRWQLMVTDDEGRAMPHDHRFFADVATTIIVGETLSFAALQDGEWRIERISADGAVSVHPLPDRLAIEQQLARLAQGLPIQDSQTVVRQRPVVVDPASSDG